MNDASGEHVEEHARALEAEAKKEQKEAEDGIRWWFASSAFPMIAGTLGPVASAFSICALVRPWRQHLPPGTDIRQAQFINDPGWLIIINAIQLGVALIANMFLLLNMARRIRFTVSMPVTIVGWYLSSATLVALTATAAGPIVAEPKEEHVWSQAFYYGIFSAVLYFIVASLLVVTGWGANAGRYEKDFQLTASQRTLMLQTIMFLMYLLIGALVFSNIEGWAYLDAVYWADVTLFTVGFGDMGATTTLGRALLFPYALVGVISLGLVIGSIRSLVLERGRRNLDARMVEKKRRNIVRRLTRRGKDEILVPIREDSVAQQNSSPSTDNSNHVSPGGGGSGGITTEFERREKEFRLMRQIQKQAAKRRRWVAMAMSSSTWVVLWLVGARIFQNCEANYQGWSYFDAVYFAFVSLTTIGYGDVTPTSNAGRAFFVFWSLLALPTMTVLISNAGDTVIKSIRDVTNQVGSITILPGEQGLMKDFKAVLQTLSCGVLFGDEDDDVHESPPGFLGDATARNLSGSDDDDGTDEESGQAKRAKSNEALADEENVMRESSGASSDGNPTRTAGPPKGGDKEGTNTTGTASNNHSDETGDTPTASPRGPDFLSSIPTNRADYLVLLADEITRVTQHLKHKPPRKYPYAEWAWYLRLMGEDERSAETHRRAIPHVHHHNSHSSQPDHHHHHHHHHHLGGGRGISSMLHHRHHHHGSGASAKDGESGTINSTDAGGTEGGGTSGTARKDTPDDDVDRQGSWSWVGPRSPLMGAQEEADWIHEKLVMRLAAELRAARDEEKGGKEPETNRKRRNSLGH